MVYNQKELSRMFFMKNLKVVSAIILLACATQLTVAENATDKPVKKTIHFTIDGRSTFDPEHECLEVTVKEFYKKKGWLWGESLFNESWRVTSPTAVLTLGNPDIARIEIDANDCYVIGRRIAQAAVVVQFKHGRCIQRPQSKNNEVTFDCDGNVQTLYAEIKKSQLPKKKFEFVKDK